MDRLTKGWVYHLRKTARQESQTSGGRTVCPLCDAEVEGDLESFKAHVRADALKHSSLAQDGDVEEAFSKANKVAAAARTSNPCPPPEATAARPQRKRPVPGPLDGQDEAGHGATQSGTTQRGNKKLCSPPSSVAPVRASSPSSPTNAHASSDFSRPEVRSRRGRQLWTPDDDGRSPTPAGAPPMQARCRALRSSNIDSWAHGMPSRRMIRQPETKSISPDQLVAEVKGIYAALVMIESKCIEYDTSQEKASLNHGQYHALIVLHRSLLHEHHDFFLASQHPAASPALRGLAAKYAMPARMWRHGIHSFLELLRHKLPHSLEHMLTFIYIAYSMMALLYETVEEFKDTWIECLGDLGRYRMAIEDDDIRDREVWTAVSRYWYSKASDNCPKVGRLYHHLAILARPNAVQQLYYYTKALCVPIPFKSAQESIMTLFDPVIGAASGVRYNVVDAAFVRVNGILFSRKGQEQLQASMSVFLKGLDGRIAAAHSGWLEAGYHISISLACSLLGFGTQPSNPLMRVLVRRHDQGDSSADDGTAACATSDEMFDRALAFASQTWEIVLRRWGDKNTLSFIHATLVFLWHVTQHPDAVALVEQRYPWKLTAAMLNLLLHKTDEKTVARTAEDGFPWPPEKGAVPRPLPEDYALRGLVYAEGYFPETWFTDERIDEEERMLEPPSKALDRQERILWIARRVTRAGRWLTWSDETGRFGVADEFDVEVDVDV